MNQKEPPTGRFKSNWCLVRRKKDLNNKNSFHLKKSKFHTFKSHQM